MKKVILLSLFSVLLFGEQNLFNALSSEITKAHDVFFEQQLSLGNSTLQMNSTFCYGLSDKIEVGFDIFNVNVNIAGAGPFFLNNDDDSTQPLAPVVLGSVQLKIYESRSFRVSA